MAETLYIPELESFFVKVLRATKKGIITWEPTADPEVLTAPLEGEYSLRLELTPDFEGTAPEPDHILSLYKGRKRIITVDRRDISKAELDKLTGGAYEFEYNAFSELWKYASLKASRIPEELEEVNRLLERKLQEGGG
jgi:hypothetical protein